MSRLERRVRETKRNIAMLKEVGDTEGVKLAKKTLAQRNKAYNDYCAENNLKPHSDRLAVVNKKITQEAEKKSKVGKPHSVNFTLVKSVEYHQKFNGITNDAEIDNLIYQKALDILNHRNNTDCEDMHLIDAVSKKVVGTQTHSTAHQEVVYNKSLNNAIKNHLPYTLISIHNHPESNPPSGSDFASCGSRKYQKGVICCHNGDVYIYQTGKTPFTANLFDKTVDKYKRMPYNMSEKDAYIKTLKQFEKDYGIKWEMR